MPDTPPTPSRDAAVTATCPCCQRPMPADHGRRYCSPRCRQVAYRRRQGAPAEPTTAADRHRYRASPQPTTISPPRRITSPPPAVPPNRHALNGPSTPEGPDRGRKGRDSGQDNPWPNPDRRRRTDTSTVFRDEVVRVRRSDHGTNILTAGVAQGPARFLRQGTSATPPCAARPASRHRAGRRRAWPSRLHLHTMAASGTSTRSRPANVGASRAPPPPNRPRSVAITS